MTETPAKAPNDSAPNAVILSAGQGKRLSPLTDDCPKCLVEVAGRTILDWQIAALAEAGVRRVSVVTGFRADLVEERLTRSAATHGVSAETIYNPFYSVADNIGSCWAARERFGPDTLLINGDSLFEADVALRLLAEAKDNALTVTCDRKPRYDADDMKVQLDGDRLTAIGKTLADPVDGEAIGMIRMRGGAGPRFAAALRTALADTEALKRWYLSIVDAMAQEGGVHAVVLDGERWCEVDFPTDLAIAETTVQSFGSTRRRAV